MRKVILMLLLLLLGCAPKGEDAKKKLELMGIEYSQVSFFRALNDGRNDQVALFVDAGIDVRGKLLTSTPLMVASMHGNVEAAQLLIDRGAEVDARTVTNYTALMLAMEHGAPTELIEQLRSKGGTVLPIRDADKFAIKESSADLKPGDIFEVVAQVENQSTFAALNPSFELTFTDTYELPIKKLVFHPGEYESKGRSADAPWPAKATLPVKITTPKVENAVNYHLYLLYPEIGSTK